MTETASPRLQEIRVEFGLIETEDAARTDGGTVPRFEALRKSHNRERAERSALESSAMSRMLALLLILLLPVQSGWAAISSACADVDIVGASHFGHHDHHDASGQDDSRSPDAADAHLDCPTCHGAGMAVPSEWRPAPMAQAPRLETEFVPAAQPQPPPGWPLRPPAVLVA
jgi:hypothetical protein